jgi:HK97 family phage portal protein
MADGFWPNWPDQRGFVSFGDIDLTSSSLIMAAVNFTGTVLAEPPPRVYVRDGDDWSPIPGHPLPVLIARPNQYYSGATMFKAFAYYWLTHGNVYMYKMRRENGSLKELWLLDSEHCTPAWPTDGSVFISHYEYRIDNIPYALRVEDIIHFRYGLDPRNHRLGLAPVRALLDEVLADEAAIEYSKTAMGSYGIPPYVVSPKPNADSTYRVDAEKMKAELIAKTTGSERGKPIVFGAPTDVKELGFNPSQMILREIHSLPEERVAAVLGIPAVVLGYGAGLTHSTYSNYENALKAAWQTFVVPTLRVIASELTHQLLLPEYSNERGDIVEFDTGEVWALQKDENAVAQREVMKWLAGLITKDEARAAMGLTPLGDGTGATTNVQPQGLSQPSAAVGKALNFRDLNPTAADLATIETWWREYAPDEIEKILRAESNER